MEAGAVRAAASEAINHVQTLTNRVEKSGEEIMQRHPEADGIVRNSRAVRSHDAEEEFGPIADIHVRRQLLHSMLEISEKYRRPFDSASFAVVSIMGTHDWRDYAVTVLQMAELEALVRPHPAPASRWQDRDRKTCSPARAAPHDGV